MVSDPRRRGSVSLCGNPVHWLRSSKRIALPENPKHLKIKQTNEKSPEFFPEIRSKLPRSAFTSHTHGPGIEECFQSEKLCDKVSFPGGKWHLFAARCKTLLRVACCFSLLYFSFYFIFFCFLRSVVVKRQPMSCSPF